MILEAEAYPSASDLDRASASMNGIETSLHPGSSLRRLRSNAGTSRRRIGSPVALGLADEEAQGFDYPEGRPDAMFRVLAAERALGNGEPEHSEELARDAVRRDPACCASAPGFGVGAGRARRRSGASGRSCSPMDCSTLSRTSGAGGCAG
jgi:hypothetical protein